MIIMKSIKLTFAAIICTMFFTLPSICAAYNNNPMRLGVLPVFKAAAVSSDITLEDTKMATNRIFEDLLMCDDFELLEREEMERIVQEHELGAMGMVDQSQMAQWGKLHGAEYLLISNLTGLSSRKKVGSVAGFGSNSYQVIAHVSSRIIEVETGRVVLAASGQATSTVKLTKAPLRLIRIGSDEVDQELVHDAVEKAAGAMVEKLLANLERKKQMR